MNKQVTTKGLMFAFFGMFVFNLFFASLNPWMISMKIPHRNTVRLYGLKISEKEDWPQLQDLDKENYTTAYKNFRQWEVDNPLKEGEFLLTESWWNKDCTSIHSMAYVGHLENLSSKVTLKIDGWNVSFFIEKDEFFVYTKFFEHEKKFKEKQCG